MLLDSSGAVFVHGSEIMISRSVLETGGCHEPNWFPHSHLLCLHVKPCTDVRSSQDVKLH